MNLPKIYEPKQYEPTVYGLWESANSFAATGQGTPYCIVMPPPNANGNLHIGHALDMNLKDISVRYRRMKGDDALFIPGSDHAGFETWVVYEKFLQEQGKSRFDFSREELYNQVWDFVEARRGDMELQLRALGISCSWADGVFTLDRKVIDTVYDTFKKMWDDELIYRGERIVNYCTTHQTSFADIEVVHKEEPSKLWHIAYPLLDHIGEIVVATTRPETLLGDTAIAVHPDDKRYKKFIGSRVMLPIIQREIPVVADDSIDPTFGTGAVKVTPAHDPTDFEIGVRHSLPRIKVIGQDGTMTEVVPADFRGLTALEARKKILIQLESHEAIRKTEDYTHQVGHCYKCGTVIQPLLMDQWFVRVKPLAERAIEAIEAKRIAFHPASKAREIIAYFEQLRDWNISRQPAWGIPIPAFQNVKDPEDWIFDTRVDQETIDVNGKTYKREEDTFDTWFSSGQWPYIVTDALTDSELKRFYPTDLMETGSDLLRPWVARMIMFALYRTGDVPFKSVYMHGMVLDEKGQKMSKSKGNVINPMDVLGEYGSDALRMGIVVKRSPGQNQAFSTASVIAGRNFCNKLWNMARFIEGKLGDLSDRTPRPVTTADHWVMRQLTTAAAETGQLIDDVRYAEAVDLVYHCIWDDVADWYLEASKDSAGQGMLAWVLETCLKLAHPFAPFVTETIWTTLKFEQTLLIRSAWPIPTDYDEIAAAEFDRLRELVIETRYVASELPGGKQTMLYEHDSLIEDNRGLIARLAHLADVQHVDQPRGLRLAVPNREAWLDVDAETLYHHQSKLELRLVRCREDVARLQQRLANDSYVQSAPPRLVEETRSQLTDQLALEKKLIKELDVLSV
ncbi:MAG: valine--tRNA ligase [Candidatus Saccharimonadales bacterium]